MIREAIASVVKGENLSEVTMTKVMDQMTEGHATPAQIGALLIGLRIKGEVPEEIAAAARVMRAKSVKIPVAKSAEAPNGRHPGIDMEEVVADTCGTGGDGAKTFNVSTTAAFVVAGAGIKVAKHGNRSVSSLCGSADVVEALGLRLDLTPGQVGACIDRVGIGFLYAPLLHGAMRHVIGPRRELGLRTVFNLLGPLTNPAGATVQIVGVYAEHLTETIAKVLDKLGCRSAFVVYGAGSYDEISITGPTTVTRLLNGDIKTNPMVPEDVGLKSAQPEDIRGGDASRNAAITLGVLNGEKGAPRDMVLLNAAAVLVAAGRAASFREGIELSTESIDSGRGLEKLRQLVATGDLLAGAPVAQAG
jgi:anthranilate phosphoribosyltransferase